MPQPLYPPRKDPVPIAQEAGGLQSWSGRVRKISPQPGFDPQTVQPVASQLYRLSYPSSHDPKYHNYNFSDYLSQQELTETEGPLDNQN